MNSFLLRIIVLTAGANNEDCTSILLRYVMSCYVMLCYVIFNCIVKLYLI